MELGSPSTGELTAGIAELKNRMEKAPLTGYKQREQAPSSSGIYTAWLEGESRCLYVGRAGNSPTGNLKWRIRAHFSGQRGSDQFCLYVYDAYIHGERCHANKQMTTRQVNERTADWIRKRVKFRWIEMDEQEAVSAEKELQRAWQPILPLQG